MHDEERIARELHGRLHSIVGDEVTIEGTGLHWHLEFARADRRCRINCFWYGPASALMLGMNPANARASGRPTGQARSGAEYLVALHDATGEVGGGRTPSETDAAESAIAWIAGDALTSIESRWPYVNAERKRMHDVLRAVEARCGDVARCVIESELSRELWAYGDGRSCRFHVSEHDPAVGCTLWLGPAQVGFAADDGISFAERWLRGATLATMTTPGVMIEADADLLERGDAAAWHWQHTRARIADPNDVLAELRPLLELLATSPIATRFFSYSSLNRFCFSASSHYPWVDEGLPMVSPLVNGTDVVVDIGDARRKCSPDRALALIEATLAAYPVQPFFGSAASREVEPLSAELAAQGSTLRAALVQRRQWFDACVIWGDRSCAVSEGAYVIFREPTQEARATFPTRHDTVVALRGWLESKWSLDELRANTRDLSVWERSEPD